MTHVGQELKHNSWISSRRVIFPIVSPTGLVGLILLATFLATFHSDVLKETLHSPV